MIRLLGSRCLRVAGAALLLAAVATSCGTKSPVDRAKEARDVPGLVALMNDSSKPGELRWDAVEALGNLGDRRAVAPLMAALKVPEVDDSAAIALAKIGDPRAVPALVAAMGAKTCLQRDHPDEAKSALVDLGPPGVPSLVKALSTKSTALREGVVDVLGEIGDARARPALARVLKSPGWIGYEASMALSKIYREEPRKLLPYLTSKDTVKAYYGLLKLGEKSTVAALHRALDRFGSKDMAIDYLNCDNKTLEKAARDWASDHGYFVMPGFGGGGGPGWGEGI